MNNSYNFELDKGERTIKISTIIILLALSIIIQIIPFILILKNKGAKPIQIRSPVLTTFNLIGLFFMNFVYFLYEVLETEAIKMKSFCSFLGNHYFEFHLIFKISYILKLHRVYKTFELKKIIHANPSLAGISKNSFLESTYLKICFIVILISFIIRVIVLSVLVNNDFMMPFHFKECISKESDINTVAISTTYFWTSVDFIDQVTTATSGLFLYKSIYFKKQYLLQIEYIIYCITWLVYSNIMRISQFYFDFTPELISFLCCIFINVTVLIVAYIPLIALYIYKRDKNSNIRGRLSLSDRLSKFSDNPLYNFEKIRCAGSIRSVESDDFDKIIDFTKSIGEVFVTNLLLFYKDLRKIEKDFNFLTIEEVIKNYENIFIKYCSKKMWEHYVKLPDYIYQDCIDKFLLLKNNGKKIKVFDKAIKYADEEFKKIKLPTSWEKEDDADDEEQ